MIDYSALANELDDLPQDGPTVGDIARADQTTELMQKLLGSMASAPQPVAAQDNTALIQALQDMVSKMQPQQAPEINLPAPVVTVQPAQRVLAWTFNFVRNPDGTIKTITATAT